MAEMDGANYMRIRSVWEMNNNNAMKENSRGDDESEIDTFFQANVAKCVEGHCGEAGVDAGGNKGVCRDYQNNNRLLNNHQYGDKVTSQMSGHFFGQFHVNDLNHCSDDADDVGNRVSDCNCGGVTAEKNRSFHYCTSSRTDDGECNRGSGSCDDSDHRMGKEFSDDNRRPCGSHEPYSSPSRGEKLKGLSKLSSPSSPLTPSSSPPSSLPLSSQSQPIPPNTQNYQRPTQEGHNKYNAPNDGSYVSSESYGNSGDASESNVNSQYNGSETVNNGYDAPPAQQYVSYQSNAGGGYVEFRPPPSQQYQEKYYQQQQYYNDYYNKNSTNANTDYGAYTQSGNYSNADNNTDSIQRGEAPPQSSQASQGSPQSSSDQGRKNVRKKSTTGAEVPRVASIEMSRHSFDSPLTADNALNEWKLAMASIPTQRHVVLTPAVSDRIGFFWNETPVFTNNFEVQFQFEVAGKIDYKNLPPSQHTVTMNHGFAFWFVYENSSEIYPKTEAEHREWNLFGYKRNFRGLGVFFKIFDKENKYRPSISAAYISPDDPIDRALDFKMDVPTYAGIFYDFRNVPQGVSNYFKLAAGPKGIVGQIRSSVATRWITCFHLTDAILPATVSSSSSQAQSASSPRSGFVGFTSYTGDMPLSPPEYSQSYESKMSDATHILWMKMWNLDISIGMGEENPELRKTLGDVLGNVDDLLKTHSSHLSEHEISESMKHLTRMMYKHISEQTPREQIIMRTLTHISSQMQKMMMDMKEVKKEIHSLSSTSRNSGEGGSDGDEKDGDGRKPQKLHMDDMKNELTHIKNILHRHSQNHQSSIQTLSQKMQEHSDKSKASLHDSHSVHFKELKDRAKRLEEALSTSSNFYIWCTLGLGVTILVFLIYLWSRFKDMEKKHFL